MGFEPARFNEVRAKSADRQKSFDESLKQRATEGRAQGERERAANEAERQRAIEVEAKRQADDAAWRKEQDEKNPLPPVDDPSRLAAADEARREIEDEAVGDREDIVSAIKELGGLPTESEVLNAELAMLKEGTTNRNLFRKNGMALDPLAEALRERGFSQIQTPADLLDAVDTQFRGRKVYATGGVEFARRGKNQLPAAGGDGSMGGVSDPSRAANHDNRTSPAGGLSEAEVRDYQRRAIMPRTVTTVTEAKQQARTLLNQPLTNAATGMIATISNATIGKMVSGSAAKKSTTTAAHVMAVGNLDVLFQNAELGETHPDRDRNSNIRAIHRFYAPMIIGKEVYGVKLTVKEYAQSDQGNRIYTVEAIDVAKPARKWVDADIGNRPTSTPHAGFNGKLRRLWDIVNGKNFRPDSQRPGGGTQLVRRAADQPVPETASTVAAQMQWLADGRRSAAFFTPGTVTQIYPGQNRRGNTPKENSRWIEQKAVSDCCKILTLV
ncbi:MAG: hypothetical protein LBK60_06435 [Verrucomicrobiales bacterium]|jgi:hypothetical protein|nr:hypothetical protein [Verrucomicrobiales bacterium]